MQTVVLSGPRFMASLPEAARIDAGTIRAITASVSMVACERAAEAL